MHLRMGQNQEAFGFHRLDHDTRHLVRNHHAIDSRSARAGSRHARLHRLRTQHGNAEAANTWLMTCTRQLTSQSASSAVSCPLRERPALEKNTSTGPNLASAAAISDRISLSCATSAGTATPPISLATLASRSPDVLRSATTTPRAPACA